MNFLHVGGYWFNPMHMIVIENYADRVRIATTESRHGVAHAMDYWFYASEADEVRAWLKDQS